MINEESATLCPESGPVYEYARWTNSQRPELHLVSILPFAAGRLRKLGYRIGAFQVEPRCFFGILNTDGRTFDLSSAFMQSNFKKSLRIFEKDGSRSKNDESIQTLLVKNPRPSLDTIKSCKRNRYSAGMVYGSVLKTEEERLQYGEHYRNTLWLAGNTPFSTPDGKPPIDNWSRWFSKIEKNDFRHVEIQDHNDFQLVENDLHQVSPRTEQAVSRETLHTVAAIYALSEERQTISEDDTARASNLLRLCCETSASWLPAKNQCYPLLTTEICKQVDLEIRKAGKNGVPWREAIQITEKWYKQPHTIINALENTGRILVTRTGTGRIRGHVFHLKEIDLPVSNAIKESGAEFGATS